MPSVNFIGTIDHASGGDAEVVSLTWEILPGNNAWNLIEGTQFGETQSATASNAGICVLDHPIDVQYDSFSSEGWPLFVCELWDRTYPDSRSLIGCGMAWLPQSPQNAPYDAINISLWKPTMKKDEHNSFGQMVSADDVGAALLPYQPPLKLLREVMIESFQKPHVEGQTTGSVTLHLTSISAGFASYGVTL